MFKTILVVSVLFPVIALVTVDGMIYVGAERHTGRNFHQRCISAWEKQLIIYCNNVLMFVTLMNPNKGEHGYKQLCWLTLFAQFFPDEICGFRGAWQFLVISVHTQPSICRYYKKNSTHSSCFVRDAWVSKLSSKCEMISLSWIFYLVWLLGGGDSGSACQEIGLQKREPWSEPTL